MRPRALLVAALVVLAGCSGVLGDGGEPTETVTPAAVPTDRPTPTPVPQLAPGITGEGIESPGALMAAHQSFFRNRSFTVRSNSTGLAANGSAVIERPTTLRVGPPGEGFYIAPERNDSDDFRLPEANTANIEWWSGGERVLLKQTEANGTVTYDHVTTDVWRFREDLPQWNLYLYESFGTENTTVVEQFDRDGRTLYRVRGNARTDEWGNVSMELLVDSRGVIHESRTVRESKFMDNVSEIVTNTRVSSINTTDAPERPSWVDVAMNRTTAARQTETAG